MGLPKARYELEFNQGSCYGPEEAQALADVLAAGAPSCGPKVKAFEEAFAAQVGTQFGLAVTSATSGLELAMIACEVGPGDEVITTPLSWISTANAIAARGATVVFADVDPRTFNLDPAAVARKITAKTKAILPVHLYGQCCDMDGLNALARPRGIRIVEDCAHAPGATYRGRQAGNLGDIGVFSFHQQKNMVTLGEGGLVTVNDRALYERMLSYRSLCCRTYDPKGKYLPIDEQAQPMGQRYWLLDFDDVGYNYRMTDVQAAVGLVQLQKLAGFNRRRREIADIYRQRLSKIPGLTMPYLAPQNESAWHVFCVLVEPDFPLDKEAFMWRALHRKADQGLVALHADAFDHGLSQARPFRRRVPRVRSPVSQVRQPADSSPIDRRGDRIPARQHRAISRSADMSAFADDVRQLCRRGEPFRADRPVYIARSPGRLDLMGGNDDYTGGMVFESTIREATWAAAQVRADSQIVLINPQMAEQGWQSSVVFDLAQLTSDEAVRALVQQDPGIRWTAYVLGVFHWLQRTYPDKVRAGMTLLLASEVPLNKGVSSSAAVEVASMKSAAQAYGLQLAGVELAEACQWVENVIAESACGIMDQIAVVLGDEGFVLPLVCQPCLPQPLVQLPAGLTCWGLDSGVRHQVSGIEYEAARAAAFMGYKLICDSQGVPVTFEAASKIPRYTDPKYNGYLANLPPAEFRALEAQLPETLSGTDYLAGEQTHVDPFTQARPEVTYRVRACTRYAVEENQRVRLFVELIRGMDVEVREEPALLLGELMHLSHQAYTETGLGCWQTDLLVRLAQEQGPKRGIYGAKITGGGGGGTVAVLGRSDCGQALQAIVDQYRAQTGMEAYQFFGSSPGADRFGIEVVEPLA